MIFAFKLLFRILKRNPWNPDFFHLLRSIFQKRFQVYTTQVFGKKLLANDSLAFLAMYEEIVARQIYQFKTSDSQPLYIIDAGANIGMSLIFFAKKYPQAEIIAFEPDAQIARLTKENLKTHQCTHVQLIEKALWKEETTLFFASYGAAGSRITAESTHYEVPTTVLSSFLHKKVDFLKIDIEGAEIEVLRECKGHLHKVENVFVEYHSFANEPQVLEEMLELLKEAGFRYYIEQNGVTSSQPFLFIQQMQGMDCLLNIYAYRNEAL